MEAEAKVHPVFNPHTQLAASIAAGVLLFTGVLITRFVGENLQTESTVLAWISLTIGLVYGGRAAIDAISVKTFDIDVLMVVGAVLAAAIGHPQEGALLLFLFSLSGALEELAMERTQREIKSLHKLMPSEAMVQRGGAWVKIRPEELVVGDRVMIRPGDRVPTDCRVIEGKTEIDQSAITGESQPRFVQKGDDLYAGTINTDDPVEATVTRLSADSSLQKILNLVMSAREEREPVQRFIDKLDQPYSISVMVVSIAVLLIWWGVLGRELKDATYTAITLLIVASPCALVIATPTATLSAIARGARSGVLFKGGQAIERLSQVRAICFDKTGTLTIGRPRVHEVHTVAWSDENNLIAMAAGLEQSSSHPIAQAIKDEAAARHIQPAALNTVEHTTGRGMMGLKGHCPVRLGNLQHTAELIPECFKIRVQEVLESVQQRGHIGVVVSHACPEKAGGGEAAVIIMEDAVRPGATQLVQRLHALGIKPVVMLTGDNRLTAQSVAAELELDRFEAELLPQDKVRIVQELKKKSKVGVIGDGVNDAPALAAADVAIGIGSIGTEAALENADIVLLSDDLSVAPWAIQLARRTRTVILINLVFAMSVMGIMSVVTIVASLQGRAIPLSLGVLAHEGGTVLVVANSLALLLMRKPASESKPGKRVH